MEIESEVKIMGIPYRGSGKVYYADKEYQCDLYYNEKQAKKFKNGEITKEEYDNWRYNYPESVAFNSRK